MSTYTPISTQTLSSSAATVTFDGIPQTYTDLILVISGRTTLAGQNQEDGLMRLNSDTGSNYSVTSIYGTGSAAGSDRFSSQTSARFAYWFPAANAASGIFSATTVHFMNYANTTTNKTILIRQSNQSNVAGLPGANVSLWRSTAAINRIEVYPAAGGSWASGSTFTLYGIGAGSPKAFGGDSVINDGTYWYHVYRNSGVFSPMQNLSCDILLVAGGGGADGNARTGGGGAGGLLYLASQSILSGTNNSVTVGAGGTAGVPTNATNPTNGSNSTFASLTAAVGGGRGGIYEDPASNGADGGSGGGGTAGAFNGQGLGGAPTSGQGNAGGKSINRTGGTAGGWTAGGGGGGAGAAGQDATGTGASNTTNTAGNGGNGVSTYSSWGSLTGTGQNISGTYWFAGGGASGGITSAGANTYSTAGNGNGGNNTTAPTATTGGGGSAGTAAQGASGVVIVRYLV